MKFYIEVIEERRSVVEVEADSYDDAEEFVQDAYEEGKFIVDHKNSYSDTVSFEEFDPTGIGAFDDGYFPLIKLEVSRDDLELDDDDEECD